MGGDRPNVIALARNFGAIFGDQFAIIGEAITTVADLLMGRWGDAWKAAQKVVEIVVDAVKHAVGMIADLLPDSIRSALGFPAVSVEAKTEEAPVPEPAKAVDPATGHQRKGFFSRAKDWAGGLFGGSGGDASDAQGAAPGRPRFLLHLRRKEGGQYHPTHPPTARLPASRSALPRRIVAPT